MIILQDCKKISWKIKETLTAFEEILGKFRADKMRANLIKYLSPFWGIMEKILR